ncbi:uncharacterized protein EV420DRAFT_1733251 [Desarmillaria tabescens]|uniref:Glucose receptor Git3-like N-terminal domain-containing protein n=1 Tax=Armillaria tabescens TaxID=1929756 RepID=A0AA39JDG2_ARMTA|nr:uncharacterized protein EV420DRAFT_1733251 [Desarmillaria tabescens]KAK0439992.1 hypothetical protein EV420DRAFT_1733251 [Desarmillaria tabescens]
MVLSDFELVLALSNLVGSALSSLGSGFIILCYTFLPLKKHHRHLLILNLAIADFTNATNNVISGSVVLSTGPLSRTPVCSFRWPVYIFETKARHVWATDTSILAISIVTVMIVTASPESSWSEKSSKNKRRFICMMCGCTWVMPILTSFIALGKGYYTAVTGNWCWLTPEPVYVRYVLTHGWRSLVHIHRDRPVHILIHLSTEGESHSSA